VCPSVNSTRPERKFDCSAAYFRDVMMDLYLFCCVAMGLQISIPIVSNTTVELQWTDDTPGISSFKVRYGCHVVYSFGENMTGKFLP